MGSHESTLLNIAIEATTQLPLLLLQSEVDGRVLPIMIGPADLERLYHCLSSPIDGRPGPHQLLLSAVSQLGGEVEEVEVVREEDRVFRAEVRITTPDGGQICLDSRPSDATAIAILTGVPLLISEEVLDEHGLAFDGQPFDGQPGEPLQIDQELQKFRAFLDDISPEQFRTDGE